MLIILCVVLERLVLGLMWCRSAGLPLTLTRLEKLYIKYTKQQQHIYMYVEMSKYYLI